MNLVQDLARQIKASLPFAVLNEDPRNMFEKLVTYKSLSDIPPSIHIFNTTGNSTSDFIIKRENAPGGIGFAHPTLEIRAGKDVGEYNTLAFNTYAGGPLAKISTEVVAAGVYPNSIGKLHFAIQNGAGQQTMLTISENSTSEFFGKVGIGVSPSYKLHVVNEGLGLRVENTNTSFVGNAWQFLANDAATVDADASNYALAVFQTARPITSTGNIIRVVNSNLGEVFVVKDSGKVGIGTNDPKDILHVKIGSDLNWQFGYPSSSTTSLAALNDLENAYVLARIDANPLQINSQSGGGVAIGSTTPTNQNLLISENGGGNYPILEVLNTDTTASAKPMIRVGTGGDAVLELYRIGNAATTYINAAQAGNGNLAFQTEGNTKMVIANNGNVGIGTDIPSVRLDIRKDETVSFAPNNDQRVRAQLVVRNNNETAEDFSSISFVTGGSFQSEWSINNIYKSSYSGDLAFKTRAGGGNADWRERMRITNAGNVEITAVSDVAAGGTNPVYLRIADNGQDGGSYTWNVNQDFTQLQFYSGDQSLPTDAGVRWSIGTAMQDTAGTQTDLIFRKWSAGASNNGSLRLSNDGSMTIGNNHLTATPNNAVVTAPYGVGTDIGGGDFKIYGGRSTGTAVGGDIILYTSPAGGSTGTSVNAHIERMRITSDGRVGIATTPEANRGLHVVTTSFTGPSGSVLMEDARTDANPSYNLRNDVQEWMIAVAGTRNDNFEIQDVTNSNTSRLVIDTSGNVGFGKTTLSDWSSVFGNIIQMNTPNNGSNSIASDSVDNFRFMNNTFLEENGAGGVWKYYEDGTAALYQMDNSGHLWYGAPSGTANTNLTWSENLRLYNDYLRLWSHVSETKPYAQSITLTAGGQSWVKIGEFNNPCSGKIRFRIGTGNGEERGEVEFNLTYFAGAGQLILKHGTYNWMIKEVRVVQTSTGGVHNIWFNFRSDSNVFAGSQFFQFSVHNITQSSNAFTISNTIQTSDPGTGVAYNSVYTSQSSGFVQDIITSGNIILNGQSSRSIQVKPSGASNASVYLDAPTGYWNYLLYSSASGAGLQIYDQDNGEMRMVFSDDGWTSIGKPATTTGTIDSSNFGTVVASSGQFLHSRNVDGASAVAQFFGNAGECRIKGDGDLENTNNSYGAISDERLKSDIVDASSQLEDIKSVKIRKYTLDENGETHIGVVAQELEAAGMEGLVDTDEDGYKSVKYSVLYVKAVKALQEAIEKIETLETKVAALEENSK